MSKRPPLQKPSGTSRPGSAGAPRPGPGGVKTTTSKSAVVKPPTCPMAADKLKKEKKRQPAAAPPKIYENPAFSIPLQEVQTNPLLADKERTKTIRRNIPAGEDTKGLKNVILELKDSPDLTVGEFVGLVAPYTGDNDRYQHKYTQKAATDEYGQFIEQFDCPGAVLRAVLTEDMNSFRRMARKIYDTMTQDVSDVLTNQHIQLKEYEQERITMYTEKMMRAINEIFSYASNFDFEAFYEDKESYLSSLFPIPRLIEADSDEAEMHRRQQAFHRLNWLRTEGDRLAAENKRLHERLMQLKKGQITEIKLAEEKEKEAEAKRQQLEAQEAAVQKQLEHLTDKVEETMIDTEAAIRVAEDEANITAPKQKSSKGAVKKRTQKKPGWASEAASEIDEKAIEENMIADAGEVDPQNLAGVIKRVRSQASKTRVQTPERGTPRTKEKSPFHFSPIKTPPGKGPVTQEKSPFHYSPVKTPPEIHVQRPQLHTTRLRTEKVTVRQKSPQPTSLLVPPGGGGRAGATLTPHTSEVMGGDDHTPLYQTLQTATPGAPSKLGTMTAQRPKHTKLNVGGMSTPTPFQRGRARGPQDTWGGFG